MNILSNLDLNLNQILNVVVQNLTTEPSDPQIGQMYYNTQKKRMFYYNGSMWEAMDAKDSSPTAESIVRTINGGKEKIESSKVKTLDDKLNKADLINSINEAEGKIKSEKIEDLDKSITAESIVNKINSGNTKISQGVIEGLTEKLGGLETSANADLKKQDAISQASKYTDKKIKDLIGSAPQELDTLEEISKKLKEDENLRNVRPVDHYEDPNKETWKQFVYMLIGLAIGVVAMFVLVIPSVKASVSVDYNNLKKEYSQTTNKKDAEISTLKDDKKSLQKKNKKLTKRLKVYEGSKGEDSMYDSILKASQAYSSGNYVECAKHLLKVDKGSLPSTTAKNPLLSMKPRF